MSAKQRPMMEPRQPHGRRSSRLAQVLRLLLCAAASVCVVGQALAIPPAADDVRRKWKPASLSLPVVVDLVEAPRVIATPGKRPKREPPAQVAYRVRLESGPVITLESQHYQTGAINSVQWGGTAGRPLSQAPLWLQWLAGREAQAIFRDFGFDAAPTGFALSPQEPPAVLWVAGGETSERDLPKIAVDRETGRLVSTIEVPNRQQLLDAQPGGEPVAAVVVDVQLEWRDAGDLASHVTMGQRGGLPARRYKLVPRPFTPPSGHGAALSPAKPAPPIDAPPSRPQPQSPPPPAAPARSPRGNSPAAPPAPPWGQ